MAQIDTLKQYYEGAEAKRIWKYMKNNPSSIESNTRAAGGVEKFKVSAYFKFTDEGEIKKILDICFTYEGAYIPVTSRIAINNFFTDSVL